MNWLPAEHWAIAEKQTNLCREYPDWICKKGPLTGQMHKGLGYA